MTLFLGFRTSSVVPISRIQCVPPERVHACDVVDAARHGAVDRHVVTFFHGSRWLTLLVSMVIVLMPSAATTQEQRAAPSLPMTRVEKEEFLSKANIVDEGDTSTGSKFWRVTLDDGSESMTPPSRHQPHVTRPSGITDSMWLRMNWIRSLN